MLQLSIIIPVCLKSTLFEQILKFATVPSVIGAATGGTLRVSVGREGKRSDQADVYDPVNNRAASSQIIRQNSGNKNSRCWCIIVQSAFDAIVLGPRDA